MDNQLVLLDNPLVQIPIAVLFAGAILFLVWMIRSRNNAKNVLSNPNNKAALIKAFNNKGILPLRTTPATQDDIKILHEQLVVIKNQQEIIIETLEAIKSIAAQGNGRKDSAALPAKPKEKSSTEKVIEVLSQGVPVLDVEIAEQIGSVPAAVKKLLSTNFEEGKIPGLANLGRGYWMIVNLPCPSKTEPPTLSKSSAHPGPEGCQSISP
jgi:hypothetical protein